MLNDYLKSVLIGIFVIAACISVVMMLLFLRPTVGDNGQLIHAKFANIDKISVGTRVNFAGKPVGQVAAIREVMDSKEHRTAKNGKVYAYELDLLIDSGVRVYKHDEIATKTSGLLGDKAVNITPKPIKEGQELIIVTPNDVIFADESGSVEEAFTLLQDLGEKIEDTMQAIGDAAKKMASDELWEHINSAMENVDQITAALNEPEELKKIIAYASDTAASMANVSAKVEKGEGTVGRLIVSDDLYLRLKSLFSKGEILFNDINHYGLLFQHDKGWQRLRARRLNLMQKLSTPQEFQNFFQDEMDEISTSLSRVSMVLDQTNDMGCLLLPEFTSVYKDLLQRVEGMEEALRLYNQELINCHP